LKGLVGAVEVYGLKEIIPSMNDIFIKQVSESINTTKETGHEQN
jgi:hypothetical protein